MIRKQLLAAALACGALAASAARGDDVRHEEKDGIKYQVTTQVVQRPVSETRYEQREYTAYRERYTTDMQDSQRTYQVPVTEQQWVPGYQRGWNVFAPPVLTYRLMPVTRWETRSETVRIPVTRKEYIPEKQVQQVPIVTQRLAQEEHVHRVPIGTVGGNAPLVATRNDTLGGTRLDNDPPRDSSSTSGWRGGLDPSRP